MNFLQRALLFIISPFVEVEIQTEPDLKFEARKGPDGVTLKIDGEVIDPNSEKGKHIVMHLDEAAQIRVKSEKDFEEYMKKFAKELYQMFGQE